MGIHAALLRGINVGGKNKIKMAELREALAASGLSNVQTYIQSGNLVFESDKTEAALCEQIEKVIAGSFDLTIPVIIRSAAELHQIAGNCPFTEQQIADAEAGTEAECLYISMLRHEPQAERIAFLEAFDTKGDQFYLKGRDLFLLFHQSIRDSKLAVQVEKLGVPITTRNWKTLNKLVAMCEELRQ